MLAFAELYDSVIDGPKFYLFSRNDCLNHTDLATSAAVTLQW